MKDNENQIAIELSHYYGNCVASLIILGKRNKRPDGLTGVAEETTTENRKRFLEGLKTAMGKDFSAYKSVTNSVLQEVYDLAEPLDWRKTEDLNKIQEKYRQKIPPEFLGSFK